MNTQQCDVCGEGPLRTVEESTTLTAGDITQEVPMRFTECQACGTLSHDEAQARFNRRQRLAFRKGVEELLTGEQIQALRAKHGLTQKAAAALFGGGPVAFAKYEADDVSQSQAMDRLLRAYDQVPALRSWLHRHGDVPEVENQVSEGMETASSRYHVADKVIFFIRSTVSGQVHEYRRPLHHEEIIRDMVKTLGPENEEGPNDEPRVQWNKRSPPGIHRSH